MDTPSSVPVAPVPPGRAVPRWLRVSVCVGLLGFASAMLAYLVTWVNPSRTPAVLDISIKTYKAWPSLQTLRTEDTPLFENATVAGTTRDAIQRALAGLASRGCDEPVVVILSAAALQAEAGKVFVLPSDASLDDRATWIPLQDVLEKLKACPAKDKLLVLELTQPPALARTGCVYHDVGAALPHELNAVPDAGRQVLSACGPGQCVHDSNELGASVFAHYVREALRGHADGCGDLRDGHVTVKELAAFVRARVERWSIHNRGARQTPTLLGNGADFALGCTQNTVPRELGARGTQNHETSASAWQLRDSVHQSGEFRWMPRQYQRLLALSLLKEKDVKGRIDVEWRLPLRAGANKAPDHALALKLLEEQWRNFDQQLAGAKPADAERIKKRFVEEMRTKLPAQERDAAVFAHAVNDPRLEPGMLRVRGQIVHASEQAPSGSAEALRLRLLADLAMRVEVQAWPRDAIEALLRSAQAVEQAQRATPRLPGYVDLLDEPAHAQHAGEVRLWARGYADLDDARRQLKGASEQLDRLVRLNQRWRACEDALDEALMELPWYVDALEKLPELRAAWTQATEVARACADALKAAPAEDMSWTTRVERLTTQLDAGEKHAQALARHRQALHAPFAKDALVRLERQSRAPSADATIWQHANATLSVAAPVVKAEERASLGLPLQALSRRLNEETLALDRADNEARRFMPSAEGKTAAPGEECRLAKLRTQWQLALLELAGIQDARLRPLRQRIEQCKADATNHARWCELGAEFRLVLTRELPRQYAEEPQWRERERLAWQAPPLEPLADLDHAELPPTIEQQQHAKKLQEHWLQTHHRYRARDYLGFNLESPGILSARSFYAKAAGEQPIADAHVRLGVTASVAPLTEKQPYTHVTLEVMRQVPAGAFGPVELRFLRTDDAWLEVAPDAVTLPALADTPEPRSLTHTVPLKVIRKPQAERTGLPPPIGFLVEARFEGRSYHHLVTVPVIPNTQQLQILVSADPDEPATTLGEIRVRPGKVKQPHYVYVKNLTNRQHKVHVEIKAGDALVYKSQRLLALEPDGVSKVKFEDAGRVAELSGPLTVRVLDQERQKVLDERTLRVDVMAPHEYVKAEEALYEPGGNEQNKWTVQVQPIKRIPGPAIAAQLILPVQRIPGLMSIGGGTLHVEVPTHTKTPHTLFAERLRLIGVADEEGPVYLHIDGVPRAFVYRTNFARGGEPTLPRVDDRPAVRLVAPPCVMAGINCLVDIEVDNAPHGAKLEVALGRALDDGSFKPEIVREFAEAKKRRIDLEAAKDALVFDASIGDWTATFDTRAIVGGRALRARLIDAGGREIANVFQSIIIDDTPPIARITPAPPAAKRGSVVPVQAVGVDTESGIAQVVFFLGKPEKGEMPPSAPRYKGVPANREMTHWSAAIPVPADHAGPLTVSVHVVNHAGLASVDTVALDIAAPEPARTGLGNIQGKVVEGLRAQPNLEVILLDATGREVARAKTRADGSYTFVGLAPGRYRLVCVKPESQRRATLDVLVGPDSQTRADLALML